MNHLTHLVTPAFLVLLAPTRDLPAALERVLLGWLLEHDIDPFDLATGYPIERDPHNGILTWWVRTARGPRQRRVDRPTAPAPVAWPARFPPAIFDEV